MKPRECFPISFPDPFGPIGQSGRSPGGLPGRACLSSFPATRRPAGLDEVAGGAFFWGCGGRGPRGLSGEAVEVLEEHVELLDDAALLFEGRQREGAGLQVSRPQTLLSGSALEVFNAVFDEPLTL